MAMKALKVHPPEYLHALSERHEAAKRSVAAKKSGDDEQAGIHYADMCSWHKLMKQYLSAECQHDTPQTQALESDAF